MSTPCLSVNRLCGSGFQSVVNAAQVSGEIYAQKKIIGVLQRGNLEHRATDIVAVTIFLSCFSSAAGFINNFMVYNAVMFHIVETEIS